MQSQKMQLPVRIELSSTSCSSFPADCVILNYTANSEVSAIVWVVRTWLCFISMRRVVYPRVSWLFSTTLLEPGAWRCPKPSTWFESSHMSLSMLISNWITTFDIDVLSILPLYRSKLWVYTWHDIAMFIFSRRKLKYTVAKTCRWMSTVVTFRTSAENNTLAICFRC